MLKVKSSNIDWIDYDPTSKWLTVCFNGGATYRYEDVSQTTYDQLAGADSPGKYLSANIKNNYRWSKQ